MDHLLRVHHLLYQRGDRPPVPITGQELEERLEALRRRNMGARQRCRLAARTSGNGGSAPSAPPDPVVGAPSGDQPPFHGQTSSASESPPHLFDLIDED